MANTEENNRKVNLTISISSMCPTERDNQLETQHINSENIEFSSFYMILNLLLFYFFVNNFTRTILQLGDHHK